MSFVAERQVNVRLDEELLSKIDYLVRKGVFKSRKAAFKEALLLLVDRYYSKILRHRIEEIRKGTEKYPSLTKIIIEMHENE